MPPASTNARSAAAPAPPEPARVLVRHRALRVAARAASPARLVRQHDRVEALAQRARAHVRVEERLVGDAHLLLEHEARPALVHRRDPRAVEADARRTQREAARLRRAPARATNPSSAASGSSARRAEPRDEQRAGGEAPAAFVEGVERPAHRDARRAAAAPSATSSPLVWPSAKRGPVPRRRPGSSGRSRDRRQLGLERRRHRVDLDAHQQRQRVRGDVVGRLRRAARRTRAGRDSAGARAASSRRRSPAAACGTTSAPAG